MFMILGIFFVLPRLECYACDERVNLLTSLQKWRDLQGFARRDFLLPAYRGHHSSCFSLVLHKVECRWL